jgi:hypothetical protein
MKDFLRAALNRVFGSSDRPQAELTARMDLVTAKPAISDQKTPAETVEAPLNLTIWMIERDRFGVRGRALCTDIEVYASEAVTLCDGVNGYILNTPNGETVVVEARSGGLVGHSLETVLDGIRDMPSSELIRQIDAGKKEFNRMKPLVLPDAVFWAALKMGETELESGQEY